MFYSFFIFKKNYALPVAHQYDVVDKMQISVSKLEIFKLINLKKMYSIKYNNKYTYRYIHGIHGPNFRKMYFIF